MFTRLAAGLLAGASLAALAAPAKAATPVRWNTGGAVWSTGFSAFKTFLDSGDITDRALLAGINGSGWTAEEVQEGLSKTYTVDVVGVSRFLYSSDGVKFLKDQTRSYFPYWKMKSTAVVALRSAIILDSVDGKLSSAGIMAALPVDFRLADTCNTYDGVQNVCAPDKCEGDAQCTSLLSWYVFLPACVQANSALPEPAAPAPAAVPAQPLW
ncbi:protein phosphatase [Synechococcus sp. KORDI-100]|uniref:alpha/beta hydrolase n=1 Tax=Synechococcus sp. KORDI-100 TaxID=1280380 RepID=UPI0004E064D3|nr:alpha/beta hydrolase [Synechococcus sp. KORDI-100]AII44506.1 protein phosphatase [Synechococcus sp. KORDI-100]